MLAYGRLGHPELLGDQHAADAVGNEVAISLRPKMLQSAASSTKTFYQ